ncbi:MAG: protease complex subunit PrcB family protein [Reyranellaceae bacterium]
MSFPSYSQTRLLPRWRRLHLGWIAMPLAVLFAVSLLAATLFAPEEAHSVPTRQWRGLQDGGSLEQVLVVRSHEHWQALWHGLGRTPPAVFDPRRQVAVYVSLGAKPSAGYGARLVSATEHDERLFIVWEAVEPAPGQVAAQMLTQPWLMVVVNRGNLSPVIEQRLR